MAGPKGATLVLAIARQIVFIMKLPPGEAKRDTPWRIE